MSEQPRDGSTGYRSGHPGHPRFWGMDTEQRRPLDRQADALPPRPEVRPAAWIWPILRRLRQIQNLHHA